MAKRFLRKRAHGPPSSPLLQGQEAIVRRTDTGGIVLAPFSPFADEEQGQGEELVKRAAAAADADSTTRRRTTRTRTTSAGAAATTAAAAAAAAAETTTAAAAVATAAVAATTAAVPAAATTAAGVAATTTKAKLPNTSSAAAAAATAATSSNLVASTTSSNTAGLASSTSSSSTTSASKGQGLSTGAIGGIAFGAVIGVFAISFLIWQRRQRSSSSARRQRLGPGGIKFGKGFKYQRHDDVGYPNAGAGGGMNEKDRDHQSFGNLAGMNEMGMDHVPMSEKGLDHAHTAGMTREEWLATGEHDAVALGYGNNGHNGAGLGARGNEGYYNAPGGHLSSYYGSDMNDYSMPRATMMSSQPQHQLQSVPPLPSKALAQHRLSEQDHYEAANGIGMALAGKPLSIVPEEEEERSQRFSASQGLGQSTATLNKEVGAPAGAVGGGLAAEGTPFADPPEAGKTFVVRRTFEPSMNDELVIFPGDRVQILTSYDDGWCLGVNLDVSPSDPTRNQRGVFPRDCVEELTGATGLHRVPTLPPLDLGHQDSSGDKVVLGIDTSLGGPAPATPAIEIFSPSGEQEEVDSNRAIIDRFPPPSPSASSSKATSPALSERTQRRVSSLIASRDAELFMALGEALDARDAQRK